MKKSHLIALLAALPLSMAVARAQDVHHAGMDKKPMTDKDQQMQMGKMQDNMLRMHEQMHKIMDAKDPQERERLKQEQLKMMQDNMQMMQGMMGSHGMMDGHAKGGKMDGGGKMGGEAKGNKMDGSMDGNMKSK